MMNPFDLVKNLKDIQGTMDKMKQQMENMSATGSSGGNMVQVTLNGKFEMTDIKIDPIAVDPRDVNMLQDLIIAANRNAMEKIQEQIKENAGAMTGGMDLSKFGL
jgi:DNA-binding YbaB/EbfC family protein